MDEGTELERRAARIRAEEGDASPAEAEAVEANLAAKDAIGGERSGDADVAAGEAALGVRGKSTDQAKHAAPEGDLDAEWPDAQEAR